MSITVKEVMDSDLPRACEIEVAAYAGNSVSPILFPGPFPPDSLEQRVKRLARERNEDRTTSYIKAIDEKTGDIIGFASWHLYETPKIAATAAASRRLTIGPGANKEACEAFFGGMAQRRDLIMKGKAFVYLHMLHSDPKHQGRGAGSALMRWGLERADSHNLPTFLESSPDAHTFYKKHGFVDEEVFTFDMSPYGGGPQPHNTPLMVRAPSHQLNGSKERNLSS
ncbi:acyl-CoA N-acyltransferase [Dendryphion nanum]|uniref:Acyl-CoA N-acyltransferase n=1 Tax=Dendryphion nanum TaxID=256645 RepID=A0A9P9DNC0_9PLEO|nr:acyl-CoA N-acyltransferase [Dendryphion nanum]